MAYNAQGLLHVAVFENMLIGTKVKLKNKTWNMEQKLNSNSSDGTAADSDMQPIVIPSADIAVNPVLAARAFVNIYEDTEARFIGDAEYETWEEAYSERDELSTYVETVEIVRRHGS